MVMRERADAARDLRADARRVRQARPHAPRRARRARDAGRTAPEGAAQPPRPRPWLTSPREPAVARVAVNRLWEFVFGTGIVRTSEDFGLQGEWPSHPELLDWLAVEFREQRLGRAALLRLIVTSAPSARVRAPPDVARVDPDNRCSRGSRAGASRRGDPRPGAVRLRPARRTLGGPSREALPARPGCGRKSRCCSRTRASTSAAWATTCGGAACTPTGSAPARRRPADARRADARVLHDPAQHHEHAAAGARAVERRAVRRGGARARAAHARLKRAATTARDSRDVPALHGHASRAELRRARAAAQRCSPPSASASRRPRRRRGPARVGERAAPAALDPAELAAWTMIANALLNLDATSPELTMDPFRRTRLLLTRRRFFGRGARPSARARRALALATRSLRGARTPRRGGTAATAPRPALRAQGEARDLPAHGGRAEPARPVRPQAELRERFDQDLPDSMRRASA
jgi:hypothetical protein